MIKNIKKVCIVFIVLLSFIYLFIMIDTSIIQFFYPYEIKTGLVVSGSMRPVIEVNDFIIVKKTKDIAINDIITFKKINKKNETIHRVIRIDGNTIVTKGDAKETEDDPIEINQVTGVYVSKIKYIGSIISFAKKSFVLDIYFLLIAFTLIPFNKISNKKNKTR